MLDLEEYIISHRQIQIDVSDIFQWIHPRECLYYHFIETEESIVFASSKTTAFGFWLGWIVKHVLGKDALIVWAIGSWISAFIDYLANCIAFESFSSTDWLGFYLYIASKSNKWKSWRNPMYGHEDKKLLFNFWEKVVRRHFWGVKNCDEKRKEPILLDAWELGEVLKHIALLWLIFIFGIVQVLCKVVGGFWARSFNLADGRLSITFWKKSSEVIRKERKKFPNAGSVASDV